MTNLVAFENYLQFEKKYSPHTVLAYTNDIQVFIVFLQTNFDSQELETVSYSLIRSWIVSMVDNNISNSSINRKIQSLKAFYKFLLKTKQITINPLLQHKALKTPKILQKIGRAHV